MARIANKKGSNAVNPRSRAAKRATSPGIDVDCTIKEAPRTTDATPVLAALRSNGIQKRKKKTKNMTRGQRARQEKGLSRAEAVMDQMSKKVEEAKSRRKKVDQRRAGWEEINDSTKEETRKATKAPGRIVDGSIQNGEKPVDGDDIEMGANQAALTTDSTASVNAAHPMPSTNKDEVDLIS